MAVARSLARDHARENEGRTAASWPLLEEVVGDYRQRLGVLLGAVALVLLIACANVANLFLGRGAARERELALRAALGAGRGRLARQLLTESLALGLLAAAVGLVVAEGGRRLLLATAPPGIPRLAEARLDLVALAFTMTLGLLASVLFGLAPALQAARIDLRAGLSEGGRGVTSGRDRLRRVLVAAEVGLALTLLVGAGLLLRTGVNLSRASLGFDAYGVLSARIGFPAEGYPGHERPARAFEAILERLRARPEVGSAALVSKLPLTPGQRHQRPHSRGARVRPSKSAIDTDLQIVSPGYFETMRIPLRAGRSVHHRGPARDAEGHGHQRGAGAPGLSGTRPHRQTHRLLRGRPGRARHPVLQGGGRGGGRRPHLVAGRASAAAVLPAARPGARRGLGLDVPDPGSRGAQRGGPNALEATLSPLVRAAVREVDPAVPVYDVRTMVDRRQRTMAQERFGAALLSGLGVVGLLLAGVGIYGVVAFFVSQRTREMAVRLALGARIPDVVGLVVRQGLHPVLAGLALGLVGAVVAGRALRAVLFGVGALDPTTLVAVTLVLLGGRGPRLRAARAPGGAGRPGPLARRGLDSPADPRRRQPVVWTFLIRLDKGAVSCL